MFRLAPAVALVPYLVALVAIPLGPGQVAQELDLGLFFVLAVLGVGVLGQLMAGWASASKFALLGGLRTAAQLMAYELPLVLAAASVAMAAGTLSLTGIVAGLAAVVAGLAGARDAGVLRRRAGRAGAAAVRHAVRRLRDHLRSAAPSTPACGSRCSCSPSTPGSSCSRALTAVLFLGGWRGPAPEQLGWLWTLAKTFAVAFVVIWVRVSYPRLREDQLQRLAWQVLVPLALAQLVLTGVVRVVTA